MGIIIVSQLKPLPNLIFSFVQKVGEIDADEACGNVVFGGWKEDILKRPSPAKQEERSRSSENLSSVRQT